MDSKCQERHPEKNCHSLLTLYTVAGIQANRGGPRAVMNPARMGRQAPPGPP